MFFEVLKLRGAVYLADSLLNTLKIKMQPIQGEQIKQRNYVY